MRQVPGRHIAIAIPRMPEVEVCPVNLGLSGAGGVQGGAGVAVQEHVIPSWLAGLNEGRLRHGAATASGVRQQSGTAQLVPEKIGAWRRRVLLDPVVAMAQQLPPPPTAERGAADRQLGAELLGSEPGVRGGHGSRGCRGGAVGEATQGGPGLYPCKRGVADRGIKPCR